MTNGRGRLGQNYLQALVQREKIFLLDTILDMITSPSRTFSVVEIVELLRQFRNGIQHQQMALDVIRGHSSLVNPSSTITPEVELDWERLRFSGEPLNPAPTSDGLEHFRPTSTTRDNFSVESNSNQRHTLIPKDKSPIDLDWEDATPSTTKVEKASEVIEFSEAPTRHELKKHVEQLHEYDPGFKPIGDWCKDGGYYFITDGWWVVKAKWTPHRISYLSRSEEFGWVVVKDSRELIAPLDLFKITPVYAKPI